MRVRFYISPESGRPHVEDHGVSTRECVEVLEAPLQDYATKDGVRVALGRSSSGDFLRVIYKPDESGPGVFVITAYPLRGKPLTALKRRLRKRGQR